MTLPFAGGIDANANATLIFSLVAAVIYAFTLGMCFQVSDVQCSASDIRRVTLVHALVSFVFNTTIVALSLNVMFQLLSG